MARSVDLTAEVTIYTHYTDANNNALLTLATDGSLTLETTVSGSAATEISGGAGTVSSTDDVRLVIWSESGTPTAAVYVEGALIGANTDITGRLGAGRTVRHGGGLVDSIEIWPFRPTVT